MAIRIGYLGDGVVGIGKETSFPITIGDKTYYAKFSVDPSNINNSGLFAAWLTTNRYMSCRVQNGTPCKLRLSNDTGTGNYWEFNITNYSVVVSVVIKYNTNTVGTPIVFVNGVQATVTTVGTAVAQPFTTNLTFFGYRGGAGTNGFSGTFYDFAMYDKLLSDRECKALSVGLIDPVIFNPTVLFRFLQNGSPFKSLIGRNASTITNTYYSRHLPTNYLT